jgi:hypothetical protein
MIMLRDVFDGQDRLGSTRNVVSNWGRDGDKKMSRLTPKCHI